MKQWRTLTSMVTKFLFLKIWWVFWVSERLLASKEELCSMKLIIDHFTCLVTAWCSFCTIISQDHFPACFPSLRKRSRFVWSPCLLSESLYISSTDVQTWRRYNSPNLRPRHSTYAECYYVLWEFVIWVVHTTKAEQRDRNPCSRKVGFVSWKGSKIQRSPGPESTLIMEVCI